MLRYLPFAETIITFIFFEFNNLHCLFLNLEQVMRADNSSLAADIRKEMKVLNGKLLKTKDKNAKREIRKELRTLAKEEKKRQQLAVADVIKNADVVLTTLTGAFSRKLDNYSFDLVVIDEAAQALEVACWIALLKVQNPNQFIFTFCGFLFIVYAI
jgi:superfamily I DNA and/or RNA helicase